MSRQSWFRAAALIAALAAPTALAAPALAQDAPAEAPNAEYRTLAEAALTSEQTEVRRIAILTLGALVDETELKKDFRKYLEAEDAVIRRGALVALALRGDKKAASLIQKELEDLAADFDLAFAGVLQPLPAETRAEAVASILKKSKNEPLQTALLTWIARDGDDALFALLPDPTKAKKDTAMRDAMLLAVKQFPRDAAMPIAEKLVVANDVALRQQGIELAAAIDGHDALQLVAKALADADEALATKAAEILVVKRHPAAVPVLEKRLEENPRDIDTVRLLLEFEVPDITKHVLPIVQKENPSLDQSEYNDILALVAATKTAEAIALVETKLASTYESDRIAGVWAMGFTENTKFTPQAILLVDDGSFEIRKAAAATLGRLADPSALEDMNKALIAAKEKDVKLALIRSFGQIGDKSAAGYLQFSVADRDNDIRIAALDALAALKAQDGTKAVEIVAQDADPAMRWKAVVTLFTIDSVVYGERLKKAVADAPEDAFLVTLAELSPEMQTKLEDEVLRSERSALALALVDGWIAQGRNALPRLRAAVDNSKDADVRIPALKHLARYAEPDDRERIAAFVNDGDRKIRLLALRTLLNYPKAETESIFQAQVDSDDPLFQILGVYGVVR